MKTKFLNVFMAIITFFSITYMEILPAYHMVSWLILGCLIFVFLKVNLFDSAFQKEILFFSLLFSFLNMLGNITFHLMDEATMHLFKEIIRPVNLLYFFGLFNFFLILLKMVFPKLYSFSLRNEKSKIKHHRKFFFLLLVLLFLCWLPYFLVFYPGIISYDSIEQLEMIIHGFDVISDHHPILHTIFIAIPYHLGFGITKNVICGAAMVSLFQMLFMASIFSSFLVFLHQRKVNDKVLLFVFLFYAILPVHGYYSITMWKDVIFGGSILLLVMEIVKLLERDKTNTLTLKSMIPFLFVSLLCVFFRNNGIYLYFIVALFGLLVFPQHRKKLTFVFFLVFGLFFFVKGPVFDYFQIKKSESVEYLAMPLQQIGRMAYKNITFTKKEQELLNQLMPIEQMALAYNPQKSDGIKFSEYFHEDVLNQHKKEYLALWFRLILKHPDVALESYFVSTVGYWYPGTSYWSVFNYVYPNEIGLKSEPFIPSLQPLFIQLTSKRIPLLNLEWSIGLCFWMICLFGVITFKKRGIKFLYPYVPIFGIWVTMMLASPVFAEFRYVYGAFTCLPLLILMPYLHLKGKDC